MANVYEKLQQARIKLQSKNIKQSGKNTFAKYDYFELGDFLPHVNVIFHELKLFSHVSFTPELATLTIVNAEKPEETIVFTSPMAEANLKGVHAIQNLGAVQTYQRRYLYMAALEISDHDALDANTGKENASQPRGHRNGSPKQPAPMTNEGMQNPFDADEVTAALTLYHAAMNGLVPNDQDRKDLLRLGYAKWAQITPPESTKDIPAQTIRKYADIYRQKTANELAEGLKRLRSEFNVPDSVPA